MLRVSSAYAALMTIECINEPMAEMNRRGDTRCPIHLESHCFQVAGSLRGSITDLSASGCCFKASGARLEAGAFVAIRLRRVGLLDATVAWAHDQQCGIAFHRSLHVAVLDHLVASNPATVDPVAASPRSVGGVQPRAACL
jgi:hypothetical protein